MRTFAYSLFLLIGIVATLTFWFRLVRKDDRLFLIYVSALVGAFLGAKAVFLLAEGWMSIGKPDMWMQLATGKSILGALLGGYLAVEWMKSALGYTSATGDWFAIIVPVGVIIGRVGCLFHGCCLGTVCAPAWYALPDAQGTPRWPAVPLEMAFNAVALLVGWILRRKGKMSGQHFHLYLIAYGLFRLLHEIKRATPPIFWGITGYQIAAVAVSVLGVWGYVRRRKQAAGTAVGTQTTSSQVA